MKREGENYWALFWRTGLPEAYLLSRRERTGEQTEGGQSPSEKARGGYRQRA